MYQRQGRLCGNTFPYLSVSPIRYGALNETQVSQSDVVDLERRWKVSVLRIRHQTTKAGALSALSNESALILNLLCDRLFAHSLQQERGGGGPIDPVLI